MGYQRANWHSGLTYRQTCEQCKTVVQYQDDILDFRPWFADGFVYCPTCKKPLRHNENYAINRPSEPQMNAPCPQMSEEQTTESGRAVFCTKCGKAFGTADNFCANCGAKRD